MKNVAVFFGGVSVEHDVSIITGAICVNCIDKTKYNAIPIFVDKDGKWYTGERLNDIDYFKSLNVKKLKRVTLLPKSNILYRVKGKRLKEICNIAVAVNCMHGERGEDGSLAGFLNMCDVAFASPSILSSSVCMDKCFTKTVMKGLGVNVLPSVTICSSTEKEKEIENLGFPLVVKPACLGSSIAVSRVDNQEELEIAINQAFKFGEKVIVEKCLENFTEINCAVYQNSRQEIVVSECEQPKGSSQVLSFEDKYLSGERVFPAQIDKKISDRIKKISKKVYQELFCEGVIRIDYMLKDGKVYLNEVNTVPGSLSYYLFGDTLASFSTMLNELLAQAEIRYSRLSSVQKSFKTSILASAGSKGVKRL